MEVRLKSCPRCGNPHEKTGTFCSRSCANARNHSPDVYARAGAKLSATLRGMEITEKQRAHLERMHADSKIARQRRIQETPFSELKRCTQRKLVLTSQNGKCLHCDLSEWQGQPLVLELDHVDGNKNNNTRENLRMLCPNCHSQTPTWRRAKKHPFWSVVPPTGIEPVSQV